MRIEAKFDREKIWYRGDSVRYLVLQVTDAGTPSPAGDVDLNVALVVDASGSMAGRPLEFAIESARRIIAELSDRDCVSVVSFSAAAADHVIAERMTPRGRERALSCLERIEAGGNTNLSAGWLRGAEHVAKGMESGRPSQNRVIVLSDGHANEGIVDPSQLAKHAEELALRGLFTSSVGIGDDYNSQTLEAIAVHGGGSHHRAARPHEIVEVVTAEMREIRTTVAENIVVEIEHAPGARIKCLNEFPLSVEGGGHVCRLGSLATGASRTAVFSVKFRAGEVGERFPFEICTTWRRPGWAEVHRTSAQMVDVQFAEGKENNAQAVNPSLAEVVAPVWQAYIVRRVVRLNREGRYAEAIKRLDRDLPLFEKYARNAASGSALVAELKRLREVASREWSEGRRKEVEVAMYKRNYGRVDARASAPEDWITQATAGNKPSQT
jgi:Ca-activated chloride channel family protein